jgi:ComF family protein
MIPLRAVLDLVFPPRCLGCDRRGAYFCARCRLSVHAIDAPFCPVCHLDIDPADPICRCLRPMPLCAFAVGTYDDPLRSAILRLKFGGQSAGAEALGLLLALRVSPWFTPDLVVPVPLHPARERERGYNQAGLLAHVVAREHALAYAPDLLRRVRHTKAQSRLDAHERRHNVAGAFACMRRCDGLCIVLIDDVCTTGATLHAAAQALAQAGAAKVIALVLAATRGRRAAAHAAALSS